VKLLFGIDHKHNHRFLCLFVRFVLYTSIFQHHCASLGPDRGGPPWRNVRHLGTPPKILEIPINSFIYYSSLTELSWADVMIRLGVGHPFGPHDHIFVFPFFCRTIALLFDLGYPLWREDGSKICSAICQWSESRRTHNHILLSHLRLLSSLFVASYDSQWLR
jgi:hypothetical protein